MDSGEVKTFIGYRAQHTDVTGPDQGRHPLSPDVTLDEVKALSMWMTLKCNLVALPLRRRQRRRRLQPQEALPAGARAAHPRVHPGHRRRDRARQGHPRPRRLHQRPGDGLDDGRVQQVRRLPAARASITGKPLSRRRLAGPRTRRRPGAASSPCERPRATLGLDLSQAHGDHPGVWQRRQRRGRALHELGRDDRRRQRLEGRRYNPSGLDPDALAEHKAATGSVSGFPAARRHRRRVPGAADATSWCPPPWRT